MLYCGLYEKSTDKPFIYVCYNMHWQKTEFALPKLPDGLKWTILSDTDPESEDETRIKDTLQLQKERSVRIYISKVDENAAKKKTRKKNGAKSK